MSCDMYALGEGSGGGGVLPRPYRLGQSPFLLTKMILLIKFCEF
jgi:hypothetical protein